jgi:AmpD protein
VTPASSDWRITAQGWLPAARRVPSPNFDARPSVLPIDLLVLHNISLPPGRFGGDAVERLFTNRLAAAEHPFFAQLAGVRVSSHFLIARDGRLTQFVSCLQRAWHAGESVFEGRTRCNDFSIGVELEGTDFAPYEDVQYERLGVLCRALITAFPLRAVRGHADIAPGRKTDPGPQFDWARFARLASVPAGFLPPRIDRT